ncbi:MAG: VOC family protein [Ktedonobacteraceae bacterium]|nr:VOC family protein [Ktedonobacteraceae bacterium]
MEKHAIVHLDIPAGDPAAASKFYGDLFGWNIAVDKSYDYYMFRPEQGPGGGFVKAGEGEMDYKVGEVLIYVSTDDIDATLARVEELGGKTLAPKTAIPGVGAFAFFADPAGNRIGLFTGNV